MLNRLTPQAKGESSLAVLLCVLWWLVAGALLGWLFSWLFASVLKRQPPPPIERIVERSVEKLMPRTVDNPDHLARVRQLEKEVAAIAGLRRQIQSLRAEPSNLVEKVVEKLVPDTNGLAERDRQINEWQKRFAELEKRAAEQTKTLAAQDEELQRLKLGAEIDLSAAMDAGFNLKSADDLEIIEGIGPKIAMLLHEAGVKSYKQLSAMSPAQLQPILDRAGANFQMANPATWPEQADLAARNRWLALKALQQALDAGNRRDHS